MRLSPVRWFAAAVLALVSAGAVAAWLPVLLRKTIGPHCIDGQYLLRGTDRPDMLLDSFSCPLPTAEVVATWLVAVVVAFLAAAAVMRFARRVFPWP
jgi:hypothetical protein